MHSDWRLRAFGAGWLLASCLACADAGWVLPELEPHLACYYSFDHPLTGSPGRESDLGYSGTPVELVNGGEAMRVADAAYPGAGQALQTRQVNPAQQGNDDWKAGVYEADGVASLDAFRAARGLTLMGWIRPTGDNPGLDSTSEEPGDFFGAVGLFGLLSGTSEGHLVRALVEIIEVGGEQRLVALGRRLDEGNSLVLVADGDWQALLPQGQWTHIAASFDYDEGVMTLYRNGRLLPATYAADDDRWAVTGEPEPDTASASLPAGIKIGGSYPQNTIERNPFDGRFDDLMFFDRALSAQEIGAQYAHFSADE